jgi:hypothetical protein
MKSAAFLPDKPPRCGTQCATPQDTQQDTEYFIMAENMSANDKAALIWLEAHIAGWVANAPTIGITASAATALLGDIVTARGSFTSVQAIRTDSKLATGTFKADAKAMRDNASKVIADIKAFANKQTNPQAVYDAAGVSPRAASTPTVPPAQPSTLTANLNGDGSVTINFDGTGPVGTVWQVSRKLPLETAFTFVGNADVADKSFTDFNIPASSASATYQVQGVRGSLVGPVSFPFTVPFGSADAGAISAAA